MLPPLYTHPILCLYTLSECERMRRLIELAAARGDAGAMRVSVPTIRKLLRCSRRKLPDILRRFADDGLLYDLDCAEEAVSYAVTADLLPEDAAEAVQQPQARDRTAKERMRRLRMRRQGDALEAPSSENVTVGYAVTERNAKRNKAPDEKAAIENARVPSHARVSAPDSGTGPEPESVLYIKPTDSGTGPEPVERTREAEDAAVIRAFREGTDITEKRAWALMRQHGVERCRRVLEEAIAFGAERPGAFVEAKLSGRARSTPPGESCQQHMPLPHIVSGGQKGDGRLSADAQGVTEDNPVSWQTSGLTEAAQAAIQRGRNRNGHREEAGG